jgi:type III pantothenate kinase
MILAIDAGNSRVKWGLHDGHNWLRQESADNCEVGVLAESWRHLESPARIVVSNVAGADMRSSLENLLSPWAIAPLWVTAQVSALGVQNAYDDPGQLGSDRWAALLAAWDMFRAGALVVNAGTALTVDVLSDQVVFLGGIIVPGAAAMQHALFASTALAEQPSGCFTLLPKNSADAIRSGALRALAGAVEGMWRELLHSGAREPRCVLSGGAAQSLQKLLTMPIVALDNLVLEGLVRIAQQAEPL